MAKKLPEFDEGLSHDEEVNLRAAAARKWHYDETHGMYRDRHGRLRADSTGKISVHYRAQPAIGLFW